MATAAAFAITEHLKLIKSPISGALVTKAFSPVCGCATDKASIQIKLRHSDWVTVTIEDSSRHMIATIVTHVHRPKKYSTFFWNGRTDAGTVVKSGTYQPQIKLANARRTILLPNQIQVDTTAPKVLSASDGKGVLVPGALHTIAIHYAFSEDAHPVVYLGGRQIIRGRHSRPRSTIKWNGRRDGATLPPGRYVLQIGALDLAGNETPPSERKRVVVTLRDIALAVKEVRVRAGARFAVRVKAAVPTYTWRLAGAHGTSHAGLLRLRAPSRHGRYALVVVGEHHRRASAVVVVRRR